MSTTLKMLFIQIGFIFVIYLPFLILMTKLVTQALLANMTNADICV